MKRNRLTIQIDQAEGLPNVSIPYIIKKLNDRFKNEEQFMQQLDVICLDIAVGITEVYESWIVKNTARCVYSRQEDALVFTCSNW